MSPNWSDLGPASADALDHADHSNGLDDELRARVKGELEPGERVLWAGRSFPPRTPPGLANYLVGAAALALLLFGAMNYAHALGHPRGVTDDGSVALGSTFCVIGTLLALGVIGSLSNRRSQRSRNAGVCYAVTDRRIIIWAPEEDPDGVRVSTMPGAQIGHIERIQRSDGSGDLEFSRHGDATYRFGQLGFKHIPEVRRVEQIIRNNLMIDQKGTKVERDRSENIGDVTW
jgi:hypothetical protein